MRIAWQNNVYFYICLNRLNKGHFSPGKRWINIRFKVFLSVRSTSRGAVSLLSASFVPPLLRLWGAGLKVGQRYRGGNSPEPRRKQRSGSRKYDRCDPFPWDSGNFTLVSCCLLLHFVVHKGEKDGERKDSGTHKGVFSFPHLVSSTRSLLLSSSSFW